MADEKTDWKDGKKNSTREFWEKLNKMPGGGRSPFDPALLKELKELDESYKRRQSGRTGPPNR